MKPIILEFFFILSGRNLTDKQQIHLLGFFFSISYSTYGNAVLTLCKSGSVCKRSLLEELRRERAPSARKYFSLIQMKQQRSTAFLASSSFLWLWQMRYSFQQLQKLAENLCEGVTGGLHFKTKEKKEAASQGSRSNEILQDISFFNKQWTQCCGKERQQQHLAQNFFFPSAVASKPLASSRRRSFTV